MPRNVFQAFTWLGSVLVMVTPAVAAGASIVAVKRAAIATDLSFIGLPPDNSPAWRILSVRGNRNARKKY
jgi:hypothetical protein